MSCKADPFVGDTQRTSQLIAEHLPMDSRRSSRTSWMILETGRGDLGTISGLASLQNDSKHATQRAIIIGNANNSPAWQINLNDGRSQNDQRNQLGGRKTSIPSKPTVFVFHSLFFWRPAFRGQQPTSFPIDKTSLLNHKSIQNSDTFSSDSRCSPNHARCYAEQRFPPVPLSEKSTDTHAHTRCRALRSDKALRPRTRSSLLLHVHQGGKAT